MPAGDADFRMTNDPQVAHQLENNLLSELQAGSEQSQNTQITLEVRDDNDTLVGGLVGATSYGWLLIKTLWVAPHVRNQGYGRGLVDHAIEKARTIGCHSVWLDTSNTAALQFYKTLGFEEFGTLSNGAHYRPNDHCRFFLKKRIVVSNGHT